MAVIDFWYSIGSTYTYLSVMRLSDVTRSTGVSFRWRPFNVRHIMIEQNNIPFKDKPVKAAYMWRDVERRAAPVRPLAKDSRAISIAWSGACQPDRRPGNGGRMG